MQYVDTDSSRHDGGIAFLASGRNWKCSYVTHESWVKWGEYIKIMLPACCLYCVDIIQKKITASSYSIHV
jgi:hypothetical protein